MATPALGFFGPVTATLDWCEANYQFSHYIAELANSFSNLLSIWLALHGMLNAMREDLSARYIVGFAGFGLVGVGSFAFHATLLYEAQLADELPMILVASTSLWFLFDRTPGFNLRARSSQLQLFGLFIFNTIFCITYYIYRNPIYHQVVFAILVITSVFRVRRLLRLPEIHSCIPAKQRSDIATVFALGSALFAFGFLIWNLDNIYCDTVTKWKQAWGWPFAFLLEGHAWWHILTAVGTYLMIIGVQYLTLNIKDDHRNFTIAYTYGVWPYVKRVDKDMTDKYKPVPSF